MPVGLGFALEGSREHAEQRSKAVTHGPRPVCRCIFLGLHDVFEKNTSVSCLNLKIWRVPLKKSPNFHFLIIITKASTLSLTVRLALSK